MIEAVALALAAVLAIACALLAARPFLRDREEAIAEPTPRERERLGLLEERDRALAALAELEFDHRTGKLSDEDYREALGPLRRETADTLARLDAMMGGPMGMPPQQPDVPEPWPPPDEGDLPDPGPLPAPGEPAPGPDEPAPPQHPPLPQTREPDVA